MTPRENDIELLSAYADGELEASDAAKVAKRIAGDEKIARQAAAMAEMKSAVAALAQDVVVVTVPASRFRWLPFFSMSLAACLMMIAVAAVWMGGQPNAGELSWQLAAEQHDAWTEGSLTQGGAPVSASQKAFEPEMIAAGLTPAFWRDDLVIAGRDAMQTGYVGRNGCRVSLFQVAGDLAISKDFFILSDSSLQRAAWSDTASSYLVVARGMDESRFAILAGVLSSVSTEGEHAQPDTIAALQTMHQPCVG